MISEERLVWIRKGEISMFLRCSLGIHTYVWSYTAEKDCHQELLCGRCGHKSGQTREFHDYSEWMFLFPDRCDQERVCCRCGDKISRVNHRYSEWKAVDKRYNTSLIAESPHSGSTAATFGYTFQIDCSSRTCERCLHVETKKEVSGVDQKVIA